MEQNKEYEINFKYMLQSLLRHWYIILLSTLLFGASVFSYAKFFITPMYSSTVKMFVNNDSSIVNDYVSSGELLVARELVDTYIAILETPDTLELVKEEAGVEYSIQQLGGMISAGGVNDTQIFYIKVTSADPEEAAKIADTICKILPERISKIVDKSSVSVVQNAKVPTGKSSPDVFNYTLIGVLVGIIVGCVIIVIKDFANNSIKDENYPSNTYNVRTLAYIPNLYQNAKNKKSGSSHSKKHPKGTNSFFDSAEKSILCEKLSFGAMESYKMLRTNLQNISEQETDYKVIGITSPNPKEGKSTLSINYSYILSQTGKRVVLIEADMRKPVLAKRLTLTSRLGLSDMLLDSEVDAIQDSKRMENWQVICAGTATDTPSELLGSRSMDMLIERLRKEYDYVILDLPPVNEVSDAMTVSRCLDGVICAVKQEETTRMNLETAMQYMKYSKAEFIGFVITNTHIGSRYGKYGKKYYSYQE